VFGIEVDWYRDAQVRNNILQQQDIATQTKRYARIAENAAKKSQLQLQAANRRQQAISSAHRCPSPRREKLGDS
jgi:hypothetical protein